jgi:hypothetical protein
MNLIATQSPGPWGNALGSRAVETPGQRPAQPADSRCIGTPRLNSHELLSGSEQPPP